MKLGFIGCGKMATALIRGVIKAGKWSGNQIIGYDPMTSSVKALQESDGIAAANSNEELAAKAEAVIVCVKPGDVKKALSEAGQHLSGKPVISIAAGVTLRQLRSYAGESAKIIRVMPNTPALVQEGAAAYSVAENVGASEIKLVEDIFSAVGVAFQLKEELLDAVTGLSGSGPAFVYLVIEAMSDAGVLMGLPRQTASRLAAQTVLGSAKMVIESNDHPAVLREMVTSPGGTTIAGLEKLEEAAVRGAFLQAVKAATLRSQELGK